MTGICPIYYLNLTQFISTIIFPFLYIFKFLILFFEILWVNIKLWRRYFSILLSATNSTIVNESTKVLRALGWGGFDETGKQSKFLRQVDLRFHSAENASCECPRYYELFTEVGEDRQDTCRGDSGEWEERLIMQHYSN